MTDQPNKQPLDQYKSAFLGSDYMKLGKSLSDTAQNTLTFNYLNVTNSILDAIRSQVKGLISSGSDVADAQQLQNSILNELQQLSNDPVFQEKWRELSRSIAGLLSTMITEILDLVEKEGEQVLDKVGVVANRLVRKLTSTGVEAIQGTLSVIPGVDAVTSMFILISSAISSGSTSLLLAMQMFNSAIEFYAKLTGQSMESAGRLMDVVKQAQDLFNMIQSPGAKLGELTQQIDSFNAVPTSTSDEQPTETMNLPLTREQRMSQTGGKKRKTKKRTTKRNHKKSKKRNHSR